MPKPPAYREVIDGRMVTVANRKDPIRKEFYVEALIYPGPEMTGKPQHELGYDYRIFRYEHAEVARLAAAEYPTPKTGQ